MLTPELRWVRGFSLLGYPTDHRVLDVIAGTFGQVVARTLIREFDHELDEHGAGLVGFITHWCTAAPSFETAWDSAFGRAELALSGNAGPPDAAIRMALRLTEAGYDGSWQAHLAPTTLRLQHLLLTGVEEVVAHSVGKDRQIAVRRGRNWVECRWDDATGLWHSSDAPVVPTFGIGRAICLLSADSAPPDELHAPAFVDDLQPLEIIDKDVIALFQEGLELLDELGYSPWVEKVLRAILVSVKMPQLRIRSGSTNSQPGTIHVSYPASVFDIAETLIHECAHQYFNIVNWFGDFDDGSDTKLYWSAAAQKYRTLVRILIGYHAFANILLFYEALQEADIDDGGYVEQNLSDMRSKVEHLDEPLRGNPALTDLGLAIYTPLADRLQSAIS